MTNSPLTQVLIRISLMLIKNKNKINSSMKSLISITNKLMMMRRREEVLPQIKEEVVPRSSWGEPNRAMSVLNPPNHVVSK